MKSRKWVGGNSDKAQRSQQCLLKRCRSASEEVQKLGTDSNTVRGRKRWSVGGPTGLCLILCDGYRKPRPALRWLLILILRAVSFGFPRALLPKNLYKSHADVNEKENARCITGYLQWKKTVSRYLLTIATNQRGLGGPRGHLPDDL